MRIAVMETPNSESNTLKKARNAVGKIAWRRIIGGQLTDSRLFF